MKLKRPLPKGAVVGGIVAAGFLVLLVGWFVVVSPQKHKAADLDKQTASVEQQITDQLAQVAAARNVTAAPTIRVADVYKLLKAMPSTTDMPNILIELDQVARDSGVDLQNISPGLAGTDGSIPVSMSVAGDFYTVTDLLYRLRNFVYVRRGELEATGRLFSVDNLSLSPSGKQITATIALRTFAYVPGVSSPAPVAPVATSTDTTSTDTTQSPNTPPDAPSASGAP